MNSDEELTCSPGQNAVIAATNENDQLACRLSVHGIDAHTYERLAVRFDCRRGGMRPLDGVRYISIPVTVDLLADSLLWIETELAGRYHELYLSVFIDAKLSWSEIVIPAEIAALAGRYQAAIKILFAT